MFEKNLTDLVEKINEKGAKMASRKRLPIWLNEVLAWIKRMEMADSKLSTSCWTFQQLCWPKLHLNGKSHIVYFLHFWGAYKWSTNWKECGRDLTILEDGFVVKYTGRNRIHNCVRAVSPVPAFNLSDNSMKIAFYFEVELLKKNGYTDVDIGFCTQEFPLEGKNLWSTNAIHISHKGGITTGPAIHNTFENIHGNFEEGDVIGTGIIHSPANSSMHCFSTCNGKLLGKAELPKHFMILQLFPAITTYHEDNTIRANFGKEEWRFKQFDQLIQQQ